MKGKAPFFTSSNPNYIMSHLFLNICFFIRKLFILPSSFPIIIHFEASLWSPFSHELELTDRYWLFPAIPGIYCHPLVAIDPCYSTSTIHTYSVHIPLSSLQFLFLCFYPLFCHSIPSVQFFCVFPFNAHIFQWSIRVSWHYVFITHILSPSEIIIVYMWLSWETSC